MNENLKLLCILAHPDDESLGLGGILAKYAAEQVETYLITATRGQAGWQGAVDENPGAAKLGAIRENELRAAARLLNLEEVVILDYLDGQLSMASQDEVVARLVTEIRRIQPDVVVTFDPFGVYGHPDHIAISQLTTTAVVSAADTAFIDRAQLSSHQVKKLYYRTTTQDELAAYENALGDLAMQVDGQVRRTKGWERWAVTTQVDTAAFWQQIWDAVSCHKTQLLGYQALKKLPPKLHEALWGKEYYYRVFSLVNGLGSYPETDLFAGLR